ncbi:cryptochrome-2-like [Portunus trituberculatus]|uniref:cryptochrome-2-like n=1 Tax=Portunus trituberculatus TaxID=210409 RepID=UPI001E1CCAAB|nr:cryptochrome-2-like [Portunus trituberculatus]XP_045118531.1 cryptochrome-2-like [Portunus trituberculatus]XP_045118532.1 cryptochrome-2-like [Portunus trituberculatus]XP_045118533.1 cryptochrome-2-like [Portunus trituberculatus]XP_045118534.1 cryptochrome-2-like [Portunus trituberculatus]XP_045118535.1 cryptochrome-2-like [Portunus trituberculatus]XP_045118536.1 cryptochrome-2-like [Portunus trituberculatus]XP_045118537.1 cryptochrome-2-like [Portunus trituberculatus]
MTTVHWFRKGLRLHDNPALLAAVKEGAELRPVFVLDPWFVKHARVGINRWRFLSQALRDLDDSLRKLKSRLFVVRGSPEEVFPALFKKWDVQKITWEIDTEPYAQRRDEKVERLARESGVEVVCRHGHTLYRTEKIIEANLGKAPLTYVSLEKVVSKLGHPPKPVDTLNDLPESCHVRGEAATDVSYDVPSLKELGVEESQLEPCLYPGGETEALARLKIYMERKSWVCKFEKPKTSPTSLQPSTTVLSPYLKFGCLSPRVMYHQLIQIYKGSAHSKPPVSLLGQLLWREFFYTVGAVTPNFDRMEGNTVCRQIPWVRDDKLMDAWTNARTGYPFIDAIMTQLRKEGWIHHLSRHAVACFLTRGDLWQPWEDGMKVFEELLLDADWFLNAGNWMWLSASAFFNSYFRVYSPIAFGKNTDKHGDYIRKYLPQLAKYPENYIYEPWKAPLATQRAAGCIIGQDYPRPIVDHSIVMKRNLDRMAKAYKAGKEKKASSDNQSSPKKKMKK